MCYARLVFFLRHPGAAVPLCIASPQNTCSVSSRSYVETLGSTTVVIIAQEPHSKKSVPNLAAAYMISLGVPQNMPPAVAVVPTPPILTVFVPNSSNSGWFWRKQTPPRMSWGQDWKMIRAYLRYALDPALRTYIG